MKLSAEDAFRQFGDRVFSAAFSATGSKEDADDVVQDTFLKYWDTDQDFTDENHIKAWLLRVAINRSRDLLRSFWHRKKVPWEDYMEELPFEEPEDKSLFDENNICYVQIKAGTDTLYVTVKYGGSFAYSSDGYVQPESFSD